jgi:hypothetical protein
MIHQMLNLAINQEAGADPGTPLQFGKALLWFVGGPIALFAAISFVVLVASTDRKKKSSSLTHIE